MGEQFNIVPAFQRRDYPKQLILAAVRCERASAAEPPRVRGQLRRIARHYLDRALDHAGGRAS